MTFTTWTRKDRRIYEHSTCLLCGDAYGICQGEHKAHRPSKCLACGTPQCWTRGLARGQCAVCYIGLLDAFSGHKCGYAGCHADAVAAAPRVKYVCTAHLDKAKAGCKPVQTLRQYIEGNLSARYILWEQLTFDMDAIPVLGAS